MGRYKLNEIGGRKRGYTVEGYEYMTSRTGMQSTGYRGIAKQDVSDSNRIFGDRARRGRGTACTGYRGIGIHDVMHRCSLIQAIRCRSAEYR